MNHCIKHLKRASLVMKDVVHNGGVDSGENYTFYTYVQLRSLVFL